LLYILLTLRLATPVFKSSIQKHHKM